MNRFSRHMQLGVFAMAGVPAMGVAANTFITLDATHTDGYEVFNGVTNVGFQSYQDGGSDFLQTYTADRGGGSTIGLKFNNVDAQLAAQGFTKGDVIGAELQMTVRDFDTESTADGTPGVRDGFGLYTWTLYSINDGVTNEDFDTVGQFDTTSPGGDATTLIEWAGSPGRGPTLSFPGMDGPTAVPGAGFDFLNLPNPANTVAQDTYSLILDDTIDPTFDPRPQAGDITSLTLSDLGFITGDTNDALVLSFQLSAGAFDTQFRPNWHKGSQGTGPQLILEVVPEPASAALLGLGGLALLRRRA